MRRRNSCAHSPLALLASWRFISGGFRDRWISLSCRQLAQVFRECDRLPIARQPVLIAPRVIRRERIVLGYIPREPLCERLGKEGRMHGRFIDARPAPRVLVHPRVPDERPARVRPAPGHSCRSGPQPSSRPSHVAAANRPARPRCAAIRSQNRSRGCWRIQRKVGRLTESATHATPSSLGKT